MEGEVEFDLVGMQALAVAVEAALEMLRLRHRNPVAIEQ